jgi:hypothetical protein
MMDSVLLFKFGIPQVDPKLPIQRNTKLLILKLLVRLELYVITRRKFPGGPLLPHSLCNSQTRPTSWPCGRRRVTLQLPLHNRRLWASTAAGRVFKPQVPLPQFPVRKKLESCVGKDGGGAPHCAAISYCAFWPAVLFWGASTVLTKY